MTAKHWAARLFCTGLLFGCADPESSRPQRLVGSQSAHPVEMLRAEATAALLPYLRSTLGEFAASAALKTSTAEARSSAGIEDVIAGKTDIAFVSRALREGDRKAAAAARQELHMVIVGAEAVAVIVHPQNPIRNLESGQLAEIYFGSGELSWKRFGGAAAPIVPFAVNPKTSGTGELFAQLVTGDGKTRYRAEARLFDYSDAVVPAVTVDENSISFTGRANVNGSVRAITVNGVVPTETAILDTSYLLNRKLYAVTRGAPKGALRAYLLFVLSDRGQHLARKAGVTPVLLAGEGA